jgi:hypothetical protein
LRIDDDVSDLTGEVRRPAKNATARLDAAPDARPERDEQDVCAPSARPNSTLPYRRAGGVVVDLDDHVLAETSLQPGADRRAVRPEQVRGESQHPVDIH